MSNNPKSKEIVHPWVNVADPAGQGTFTLTGRIGASASGLLQSSFGHSSSGSITDTLASLHAGAGKGGPASSPTNAGESSSPSQAFSPSGGDSASRHVSVEESFRSKQASPGISTQNGQVDFDEFTRRSEGLETDSSPSVGESSPSRHGAAHFSMQEEFNRFHAAKDESISKTTIAPSEQQLMSNDDGAAVVALLSDPGFSVETEPDDYVAFTASAGREQLLETQRTVKSADPRDLMNPLDLIPDFGGSWEPVHLSNRFPGHSFLESKYGDIQPWADILNRYHDEVWGDMLPLVRQAREEVKVAKASHEGSLQDRAAIRRLRMLLKHLDYPMG